jgi:hypothetical protein
MRVSKGQIARNKQGNISGICLIAALPLLGATALADSLGEPGRDADGPNPLNNVYFGEQHLHTQDSADSFAMGNRNSQDDAYNFCKGKAIQKSTTGEMIQKKTPYDWCAVTDHAYLMGLLPLALDPTSVIAKSEVGQLIATGKPADTDKAFGLMMQSIQAGETPPGFDRRSLQTTNSQALSRPSGIVSVRAWETAATL